LRVSLCKFQVNCAVAYVGIMLERRSLKTTIGDGILSVTFVDRLTNISAPQVMYAHFSAAWFTYFHRCVLKRPLHN